MAPLLCRAAGGTPHWDSAWRAPSSLITSTKPAAVEMSEASLSQWGYSTRFSQPRPDSNESSFFKRRTLSCCSVDMQLTWDRPSGRTYSAWSWLWLYHIWPQNPISGFHPSLVEQGQCSFSLPCSLKNFPEKSKDPTFCKGMGACVGSEKSDEWGEWIIQSQWMKVSAL